jgi:hypothetical protein
VYYTALLINVGCHTDAHEQAKWFGDDIDLKAGKYLYEPKSFREAVAAVRRFGAGAPPLQRVRSGVEFALRGRRDIDGMIARHARLAQMLAEELGLSDAACTALGEAYEQWDGKGWPGNRAGTAIPIAARIAMLAEYVEVAHRVQGVDAALAVARRRAGTQFDPTLAECLSACATDIFGELDAVSTWAAVIEAEPALTVVLSDEQFDGALLAIANYVDLKSPFTLGHSRAVAELASLTGTQLGLDEAEVLTLKRRPRTRVWAVGRVERDLGQAGPLAAANGNGADAALLTGRILQQSLRCAARRWRSSTENAWTAPDTPGLSGAALAIGPSAGRRRRLPIDARTPAVPAGADRRRRRGTASGRGAGGATRCRCRQGHLVRRRPPGRPSNGRTGGAHSREVDVSGYSPAGCRARRSRRS